MYLCFFWKFLFLFQRNYKYRYWRHEIFYNKLENWQDCFEALPLISRHTICIGKEAFLESFESCTKWKFPYPLILTPKINNDDIFLPRDLLKCGIPSETRVDSPLCAFSFVDQRIFWELCLLFPDTLLLVWIVLCPKRSHKRIFRFKTFQNH